MSEQNETAPGLAWAAVRLILATVVTLGGLYQAGAWWAGGYTVAGTIEAAGVLGFLAGLYPGEPGADDEQGGAV